MSFIREKFDNLSLVFLILVLVAVMMVYQEREDDKVVSWFEQTITTVLGAYIGLTQGHRLAWPKPNGGTNGSPTPPPTPKTSDSSSVTTTV